MPFGRSGCARTPFEMQHEFVTDLDPSGFKDREQLVVNSQRSGNIQFCLKLFLFLCSWSVLSDRHLKEQVHSRAEPLFRSIHMSLPTAWTGGDFSQDKKSQPLLPPNPMEDMLNRQEYLDRSFWKEGDMGICSQVVST